MATRYSVDDLLDFLAHASDRGLMPAPTAQALAVACRNVLGVLGEDERANLSGSDVDGIIKRFANRRAKEFNPSSLKEYGRRVHRAVTLYEQWRANPADFSVKTRASSAARVKERISSRDVPSVTEMQTDARDRTSPWRGRGYQSAFPIRPGTVVTVSNVPDDLTAAEAERLAQFVRMLAV